MYEGVPINNLPITMNSESILHFLKESGLPSDSKVENMNIKEKSKNKSVNINDLETDIIKELINKINFHNCRRKYFGFPLYVK